MKILKSRSKEATPSPLFLPMIMSPDEKIPGPNEAKNELIEINIEDYMQTARETVRQVEMDKFYETPPHSDKDLDKSILELAESPKFSVERQMNEEQKEPIIEIESASIIDSELPNHVLNSGGSIEHPDLLEQIGSLMSFRDPEERWEYEESQEDC